MSVNSQAGSPPNARAQAAIAGRKTKVRNWLCDFSLLMSYWGGDGGRAYQHTAPVNAIYGLHEALVVLSEEGLETSFTRHRRMHEALASGLAAMGLDFLVAKTSPAVTARAAAQTGSASSGVAFKFPKTCNEPAT